MIIPYESISEEALANLVRDYCLQDWGLNDTEFPLENRMGTVFNALRKGDLLVVYSEHFETANLVPKEQIQQNTEFEEDANLLGLE